MTMRVGHTHKLLESVLTKILTKVTPILRCLLIRNLPFDFSVKYIKETHNQQADCLPRLGLDLTIHCQNS